MTLIERIADPGFTPSIRELDALITLLADDDHLDQAERALDRIADPAFSQLLTRAKDAAPPVRARLWRILGKLAPLRQDACEALLGALLDSDPKTRRNAILALGHVQRSEVEDALLQAWEREDALPTRRSLAASLGKIGSARSLTLLKTVLAEDPELTRIVQRAMLMLERTQVRATGSRIAMERAPSRPLPLVLYVRPGLEEILINELTEWSPQRLGPGRVGVELRAPLLSLFRARTFTHVGIPLGEQRVEQGDMVGALVDLLSSWQAKVALETWTEGPVRYRVEWASGGHRRALVWALAERVRESLGLINDPVAPVWELVVYELQGWIRVDLVPRALQDPRFIYRVATVPAASHPTLAAALVKVAGLDPNDVVWDPFLGAGGELVERGLAGPARALFGSDLDEAALAAARRNLDAAGVQAHLLQRDALEMGPEEVTLIVTNPPMGRRVQRHAGLRALLERFVGHAGQSLARGGQLVWISPFPERTRDRAMSAGLRLEQASDIDMGGFVAELQCFRKG